MSYCSLDFLLLTNTKIFHISQFGLCFQAFLVDLIFFYLLLNSGGLHLPFWWFIQVWIKQWKYSVKGLSPLHEYCSIEYIVSWSPESISLEKQFLQQLIWRRPTIRLTDVLLYFYMFKMQYVRWKQLGQQPVPHHFLCLSLCSEDDSIVPASGIFGWYFVGMSEVWGHFLLLFSCFNK